MLTGPGIGMRKGKLAPPRMRGCTSARKQAVQSSKKERARKVETMNKQGARQLTKQERRREEQRKREEERRRAARSKRITIISIIAASVIAVAVLASVVLAQRQTSANFALAQSQAPAKAAYPSIDGITCQNTEQSGIHIHAHVSIFIDGKSMPIPANVGIAPDGSCLY